MRLTPDGQVYLRMMQGQTAHRPFNGRVLIPALAGQMGGAAAFALLSRLCLLGAMGFYAASLTRLGFPAERVALAVALFAAHPWLGRFLWACPILTDQAMHLAVAMGMYACVARDPWLFAAAATLATFSREYGLVLVGALGLAFMPVVALGAGLLNLALYLLMRAQLDHAPSPPASMAVWYQRPDRLARHCLRFHGAKWINPLCVWGGMALFAAVGAFGAEPDVLRLCAIVPAAFVQPLFGSDFERLQAHAWPAVLTLAVSI